MDIQYTYPTGNERQDNLAARPCADEANCKALFGGQAFSFKDLIDVVNPLQQLPVIGTLYRSATGDTISTGARLAGGFLLGGPVGFMVAAINAGLESATGGDIGEHLYAAIAGSDDHQYAMNAYQKAAALS